MSADTPMRAPKEINQLDKPYTTASTTLGKLCYLEIIILFLEISMSISFFSSEKARLIETG